MHNPSLKRDDLIYPELSYKIVGLLFEVGKEVGFGHKEHFYQKALSRAFSDVGISFEEQLPVRVNYKGKPAGIYYFDFFVDGKVVLEIKSRNYFSKKDIEQVFQYLKAKNLKLGIIAHFTKDGVRFKRIVNL